MTLHNLIIVGSGAGGAVAFSELTKVSDVLLLEEGRFSSAASSTQNDAWMLKNLYRDQGLRVAMGTPNLLIGEGIATGGSTEINGGVYWELPLKIAKEWKSYGWSVNDYIDFYKNSEYFSKLLKVNYLTDIPEFDLDSKIIEKGALSLGWHVANVPRMVNGCKRANRCAFGCPEGKKLSMSKTLLPTGITQGGEIRNSLKLIKIIRDDKYIRLICSGHNQKLEFKTRNLILSCGALETIKLLENNNLLKPRTSNVSFHSNLKIIAEFEEEIHSENGTIYTRQVNEFIEDGFLIMPTNFSLETISLSVGNLKQRIVTDLINNHSKLALYTCQVRTKGRIFKFNSVFASLFQFFVKWDKDDHFMIRSALLKTVKLCFASGAKRLIMPISNSNWIYSYDDAINILENTNFDKFIISTVHLMGGSNYLSSNSIINSNGEMNLDKRISLSDSSILPSSTLESPQAAIMSLARQFATRKRL